MNFHRGHVRDEPEINLIPLIDVLLVIIIFLMLTTTYAKFSGLEINLPTADVTKPSDKPAEISVTIAANGLVLIDRQPLPTAGVAALAEAMRSAAGEHKEPVVVIGADAKTPHQRVVDVMQAAQTAGYPRISFTTQAEH